MTEQADVGMQEKVVSPWFGMLYKPRKTIRFIVERRYPTRKMGRLLFLLGFVQTVYAWYYLGFYYEISIFLTLGLAIIVGPVVKAIGNFFLGSFLSWVGGWFGGKGNTDQTRATLAWSKVPLVWGFICIVPAFLILGINVLMEKYAYSIYKGIGLSFDKLWLLAFVFALIFVGVILNVFGLWSFGLSVLALAEAHQFPIWKSLLTLATGFVICLLPFICFLIFDNFVFEPRW